jgi:hypothetical protein
MVVLSFGRRARGRPILSYPRPLPDAAGAADLDQQGRKSACFA